MLVIVFFVAIVFARSEKQNIINPLKVQNIIEQDSIIERDSIKFYYNTGKINRLLILISELDSLDNEILFYQGVSLCKKFFLEDTSLFNKGILKLEKSCDAGYLNACAYFYYYNDNSLEKKQKHWSDLAEQGSDVAMYFKGINTRDENSNTSYDIMYLNKACDCGNIKACDILYEYYSRYDYEKSIYYMEKGDSLGSYNAKFNKSLIILKILISNYSIKNYNDFILYYNEGKHSLYPEYDRFFKYGKILFSSNNNEYKDIGEIFILTASNWGFSEAKEFMKLNNISYVDYKSNYSFNELEKMFLEIFR
jgi:hypothetical protein